MQSLVLFLSPSRTAGVSGGERRIVKSYAMANKKRRAVRGVHAPREEAPVGRPWQLILVTVALLLVAVYFTLIQKDESKLQVPQLRSSMHDP